MAKHDTRRLLAMAAASLTAITAAPALAQSTPPASIVLSASDQIVFQKWQSLDAAKLHQLTQQVRTLLPRDRNIWITSFDQDETARWRETRTHYEIGSTVKGTVYELPPVARTICLSNSGGPARNHARHCVVNGPAADEMVQTL